MILTQQGRYEAVGTKDAWEAWFSPRVRVARAMQSIESICLQRRATHSEKAYQDAWTSWRFAWEQGWTPVQSLERAVRQGTLLRKVQSRLLRNALPK